MKKILVAGMLLLAAFFILSDRSSGPMVSQNGIATNQFASNLLAKYDTDADGKLNVATESFKRTAIDNVIKTESRGLLFTDADEFGNADGYVSKTELIAYLDEFDTDGDGELTTYKNIIDSIFNGKSEWAKFDEKYAEKYKYEDKEN